MPDALHHLRRLIRSLASAGTPLPDAAVTRLTGALQGAPTVALINAEGDAALYREDAVPPGRVYGLSAHGFDLLGHEQARHYAADLPSRVEVRPVAGGVHLRDAHRDATLWLSEAQAAELGCGRTPGQQRQARAMLHARPGLDA